jgi:hypothetical protein
MATISLARLARRHMHGGNDATAASAFQSITVARARTTAALLIGTEETSNYASVNAALRPIADEAEAREAEQHQGPRGWFGNRLDNATDDKGAKPIDRQINVVSEVGTQIDDGISYRTAGENLGTVDDNVKIGTLDQAQDQIAPKTEIERRASARPLQNGGPENLVVWPQQGVGHIARATDQHRCVSLVGKDGRDGGSRLARVDEGLTRAARRDCIGRRGSRKSVYDSRSRLNAYASKARLRGGSGLLEFKFGDGQ